MLTHPYGRHTGRRRPGDIGGMFPDKDPQYKGISIGAFKARIMKISELGFKVWNIDCTIGPVRFWRHIPP